MPSDILHWNGHYWLIGTASQANEALNLALRPRNYSWRQALTQPDFGVNIVELSENKKISEEQFIAIGFAESTLGEQWSGRLLDLET